MIERRSELAERDHQKKLENSTEKEQKWEVAVSLDLLVEVVAFLVGAAEALKETEEAWRRRMVGQAIAGVKTSYRRCQRWILGCENAAGRSEDCGGS